MQNKIHSKRRLRNYPIAPRQQFLFGVFTLVGICLGVGMHTLLILTKIRELVETNGAINNENELAYFILISFFMTVVVVGSFIFILNIFITHRVFGSTKAIENHFRQLLAGKELGPISTRKHDETKSLVAALNEYLQKTKEVAKEHP